MLSTPVSKNKTPAMYLSAPPPGVPQCLENSEFQDAEKGSLQNLEAETTWLVSSEAAKPLWARCPGWWAPGCREWVLATPEGSVTEVGGVSMPSASAQVSCFLMSIASVAVSLFVSHSVTGVVFSYPF